ncbi:hypothetical protein Tco_0776967 [Tanacetum coccineum]
MVDEEYCWKELRMWMWMPFMDDVLNNQEDHNTRIETRSDKEKSEDKGKIREEIRDSPLPTPIISPITHIAPLSMDKETLQELTVTIEDAHSSVDKEKLQELIVTDTTPSSSSPKPKSGRFRHYKTFIQQIGRRYGYMFARLKKHFLPMKKFH